MGRGCPPLDARHAVDRAEDVSSSASPSSSSSSSSSGLDDHGPPALSASSSFPAAADVQRHRDGSPAGGELELPQGAGALRGGDRGDVDDELALSAEGTDPPSQE